MTRTMGFPTPDFPGPPPFRFELPQDWRAMPSVQADAVVVGPEAHDGVHPNVVVANHKVPPTDDPASLLRTMIDQQVRRDNVQLDGDPAVSDDGLSCRVRLTRRGTAEAAPGDAAAVPTDAVDIAQSLNLRYIAGSHVAHVLAATGTYAPSSDESRAVVDEVIRSVEC